MENKPTSNHNFFADDDESKLNAKPESSKSDNDPGQIFARIVLERQAKNKDKKPREESSSEPATEQGPVPLEADIGSQTEAEDVTTDVEATTYADPTLEELNLMANQQAQADLDRLQLVEAVEALPTLEPEPVSVEEIDVTLELPRLPEEIDTSAELDHPTETVTVINTVEILSARLKAASEVEPDLVSEEDAVVDASAQENRPVEQRYQSDTTNAYNALNSPNVTPNNPPIVNQPPVSPTLNRGNGGGGSNLPPINNYPRGSADGSPNSPYNRANLNRANVSPTRFNRDRYSNLRANLTRERVINEQVRSIEAEPLFVSTPQEVLKNYYNNVQPEHLEIKPGPQEFRTNIENKDTVVRHEIEVKSLPKRVELLTYNQLLQVSRGIFVEGSSLFRLYELNKFDEKALRRVVKEYFRKGDIKKALIKELRRRPYQERHFPISPEKIYLKNLKRFFYANDSGESYLEHQALNSSRLSKLKLNGPLVRQKYLAEVKKINLPRADARIITSVVAVLTLGLVIWIVVS